jgi:hypothetical protein
MRTELLEEADPPLGVPERDEILAEEPDPHGRAIGRG